MFQCDDYHNSIKESTDLVTTQVMAKRTKTASHVFWYRVYRNILASSSRWSAQSWTIKTRVPIRWEWVVQLNIIRAIVVLWWMNISQKSFLLTSKNWLKQLEIKGGATSHYSLTGSSMKPISIHSDRSSTRC